LVPGTNRYTSPLSVGVEDAHAGLDVIDQALSVLD